MILNLDTIILYVKNLEKLKAFYAEVLELKIIEDDQEHWVLFSAGNASLGLHKIGEAYQDKIEDGYTFDNNTKIVFQISSDIHEYRETLMSKNVNMRQVKTFDNYDFWLCDGTDPEGNVFQIKQRKLV
mgnify:CR=1 FL=1